MIYGYECPKCKHDFEVIKSYRDIDNEETCEKCGTVSVRYISSKGSFTGTGPGWNEAHFSPVCGKVVKNNQEVREYAKRHGLVEIGNECVEKTGNTFERDREKKQKDFWDSINLDHGEVKTVV